MSIFNRIGLLLSFVLLPLCCRGQFSGIQQPMFSLQSAGSAYPTLKSNLIHYWKMETVVGVTNEDDSVGTWVIVPSGSWYATNGVIDIAPWVTDAGWIHGTNSVMNFTNTSFTVQTWVRWYETNNDNKQYFPVVGTWANLPVTERKWCVMGWNNPEFEMWVRSSAGVEYSATSGVTFTNTLGVWTHVVAGYDADQQKGWIQVNNSARAYTSAVASGELQSVSDYFFENEDLGEGNFCLCNYTGGGNANTPKNIALDEIGIWTKTLTTNEVGQLYNSGSGLALSLFYP